MEPTHESAPPSSPPEEPKGIRQALQLAANDRIPTSHWLDIILPTHNNSRLTIAFLQSLRRHAAPETYRILWIDNGSRADEIEPVIEHLDGIPSHALFTPDRIGFVAAVNLAFPRTTAPFVAIQNNDTEIYTDVYSRMRRHLEKEQPHGKPGLVGPVSTSGWQRWAHLQRHLGSTTLTTLTDQVDDRARAEILYDRHAGQRTSIRSMLAFFCVMGHKTTWDTIGPLDPVYGEGFGDDDDYCARVLADDRPLSLALDCLVLHHHRATFRTLYTPYQIRTMQQSNLAIFRDRWSRSR